MQIAVGVVSILAWQLLTTYPVFGRILLPPFFFSNPVDVAQQIVKWFVTGVIWKHLWVTLIEAILAFTIGSIGGGFLGGVICLHNTIWVGALGSVVSFVPVALSPIRHIRAMPATVDDGL